MRNRCLLILFMATAASGAGMGTQNYSLTVQRNFGGQPVPKWDHGHMLCFDFQNAVVYSYDRTGNEEFHTPIAVSGAATIMIGDVAASSRGGFAVAGTAVSPDGSVAALLVLLKPTGQIAKVIRTSPVALKRIGYAEDGTLWAVVREFDEGFRELPSHDMLRHYDASGTLIGHAVNRQSISSGTREPARYPLLAISSDRIGFYADTVGLWMETSLQGQVLGQWQLPAVQDYKIRLDNVQFTDRDNVVVDAVYAYRDGHKSHGLYLFDHRGTSFSLSPLDTTAISGSPVQLLGVEGSNVVLSHHLPELIWVGWQQSQ
jgi:hypothetical protein